MKNYALRYGLISGCVLILLGLANWFFIAKPFGYDASQVFGYLSMVVALLAVPIGVKYFRDQLNQGAVSFGQAFKIGMGISLISSIIMFFYSMIFFSVAGDEFMSWYKEGLSPQELEVAEAEIAALPEFVWSPMFQGVIMFITVLLIGLIISLISSVLMKRAENKSQ